MIFPKAEYCHKLPVLKRTLEKEKYAQYTPVVFICLAHTHTHTWFAFRSVAAGTTKG